MKILNWMEKKIHANTKKTKILELSDKYFKGAITKMIQVSNYKYAWNMKKKRISAKKQNVSTKKQKMLDGLNSRMEGREERSSES